MSGTSRRKWMARGLTVVAGASGLAVAAKIAGRYGLIPPDHGGLFEPGKSLTYGVQRFLTKGSMAPEFTRKKISNAPFANGKGLTDKTYQQLQAGGFGEWPLVVEGMVARPGTLTVADLKGLPARSQITQLTCEEGWSFIAEWKGVPLADVLKSCGVSPEAKYVVYRSHEQYWWDSIDMEDALHPQTLVTYGMNGHDLPLGHGGPLRLRVPRQLGYKSVKYITRLTVTDDLSKIGNGLGGGGPEVGYSWYGGI